MPADNNSIWFHGTNKRYLDDQLREYGEYIGEIKNIPSGEQRVGISLAENYAEMALTRSIITARKYESEPIILISSSETLKGRLQIGNTCLKIYCGWPKNLFLTMNVPIKNMDDNFGFDEKLFKDRLKKILDQQKLFSVSKDFNLEKITEYILY